MKTLYTVWVEVHRYADPESQGPDLRQTPRAKDRTSGR
jgi:hypothetical protein